MQGVGGSNPLPPTRRFKITRGRGLAVQGAGLSRRRSRVRSPHGPPHTGLRAPGTSRPRGGGARGSLAGAPPALFGGLACSQGQVGNGAAQACASSGPCPDHSHVAQSVEQAVVTREVAGSRPAVAATSPGPDHRVPGNHTLSHVRRPSDARRTAVSSSSPRRSHGPRVLSPTVRASTCDDRIGGVAIDTRTDPSGNSTCCKGSDEPPKRVAPLQVVARR